VKNTVYAAEKTRAQRHRDAAKGGYVYLAPGPPKPKPECRGCPYGRDHPCIGWCTRKVMREAGLLPCE
jgi:hypothetical protein